MNKKDYKAIEAIVISMMNGLDSKLSYHSKFHTLDVIEQSLRIADAEGILEEIALMRLKFAALFHDIGFLKTYVNHEAIGCEMFLEITKAYEFSDEDKACIQGLIMATKIPQKPTTLLQQIICDADLDYLGRSDFFEIGDRLKDELLQFKMIADNDEWKERQLIFLKNHLYHTKSSQTVREPVKQINYLKLH